jgi:hypothetical protein
MGMYYTTYIVYNSDTTLKKQLSTVDPLIEEHEWDIGYVDGYEMLEWLNHRNIHWPYPLNECKLVEECIMTLDLNSYSDFKQIDIKFV